MTHWYTSKLIQSLVIILCCLFSSTIVNGQNSDEEDFEVYLSFRHRGVINTVIISYYKNDEFYLPVNDIFSKFQIETKIEGIVTTGRFGVAQTPYSIDFTNQIIRFGDKRINLTKEDFLIKDLDNYIPARIFNEVFGLNFEVDFNNLALSLETERELPIVERAIRNQRRNLADQNRTGISYFPLEKNRTFSVLNGGFADYSISSTTNRERTNYSASTSLGLQLAGGDLEGTVFGNYNSDDSFIETNSLRWRYVIRNSPAISTITVGQTNLDGVVNAPFTGIRISNQPNEPRRFFDEFAIQGNTFPLSEVELYLNNSLVDFQTADEVGNYRFLTPLYYGASQLDVKIFGPTGQTVERSSRVQVPFTFLPKGVVNYNFNAGILDNPVFGTTDRTNVLNANSAIGITKWLTARVGYEYYEGAGTVEDNEAFTGTISSRILSNYILTLEGVSNGYYRSALNAVYPSSASINIDYTNFTDDTPIYNSSSNDQQLLANFFFPLTIGKLPLTFRTSMFSRFREDISFSTFRLDLNSRLRKVNLRLGYTERLNNSFQVFNFDNNSALEAAVTYNVPRTQNIPPFLRGTLLRSQLRYNPNEKSPEVFEILYSRSVSTKGRLQLTLGRNFQSEFNSIRFNFVFDFGKVRSNSTFTMLGENYNATQNFRGSIGYDSNYNNFLFSSRDQVGRSGAAVKLFVDNNNNNVFDEGDESINEGTIRVGRSGTSSTQKDGIFYYTQMQPYFRYNLEMNKGSIRNPMLVPELEKFSIVTDPNTFKLIEIPFYMSGIIEGEVIRQFESGGQKGIGGLKLVLTSLEKDFVKEIRTYSDGSFYEYELPPGKYEIVVDQGQLDILNSRSQPEKIELEIEAIPEGDFLEGVNFTLLPIDLLEDPEEQETITEAPVTLADIPVEIINSPEVILYEQELVTNVEKALRLIILTQNAFFARDFETAFNYINESLENFETAQGYALKGSIQYFQGDRTGAVASWRMALRFDPDIYIPTLEELDQKVTVSSSE